MRLAILTIGLAALATGCNRDETTNGAAPTAAAPASATPGRPQGPEAGITPMPQRVAVLGVLNKRNGIVRDISIRPGQAFKIKDVIVRLRACETTAPWEEEKLTGAFTQVDVQLPDKRWQRVFSGWLYKESPSLNVVEHPVYDVWVKSCAMNFPAGAPAPETPSSASNASSAPKSGGGGPSRPAARPPEAAAAAAEPTATDSNAQ